MADPNLTKRALLDAGRAEFARYGLAGARTDRIAANAKVNKQRIYAYFGNKEGMFQAVLSDTLDSLLGLVPFPAAEQDPQRFLTSYVQSVQIYHAQHPELLRLLQWESLESPLVSIEFDSRSAYYQEKVQSFARHLQKSTADAAPILFGLLGLAAWPHIVPQLAALLMNTDVETSQKQASQWAINAVAGLTNS